MFVLCLKKQAKLIDDPGGMLQAPAFVVLIF